CVARHSGLARLGAAARALRRTRGTTQLSLGAHRPARAGALAQAVGEVAAREAHASDTIAARREHARALRRHAARHALRATAGLAGGAPRPVAPALAVVERAGAVTDAVHAEAAQRAGVGQNARVARTRIWPRVGRPCVAGVGRTRVTRVRRPCVRRAGV